MVRAIPSILITYDAKIPSVNSRSIENLADYVRRIRQEKGLSTLDVERNSGNQITDGYVSQIENDYVKNVSLQKLKALAKGLGVPEDELLTVARGKSPAEDPEYRNWKYAALFDNAKKLTPEQMVKFETIMEIARREVERMLQEQAHESPRKKSKRA
jgi:transcriptional regulator with XRE-family HTH domain